MGGGASSFRETEKMGFLFFLQGPNFSIKKEDSVGGKGFWRKDTKETKTKASTTTTTTRIVRVLFYCNY